MGKKFSNGIDLVLIVLFSISILLRGFIPANLVINSPHDDYLGVELANNLLQGNWLGEWNNRTLAKPPGYSIFLYLCREMGLNPLIMIHFLYLLVCLIFIKSLKSKFVHNVNFFSRITFLVLAFNPAVFSADFSRIYRISLNSVLCFMFVSLALAFSDFLDSRNYHRANKRLDRLILSSACLMGFTYASMLLTRAEAYWILVIPLFSIGYFMFLNIKSDRFRILFRNNSYSFVGKVLFVFIFSIQIPIQLISQLNQSAYGVREVEDYFSGNFSKAIKIWASVDDGRSPLKFVPISKEQRLAVYAISPIAAKLKPVLDGAPNTGWKTFNCQNTGVCDESGGAWFPWELRDAVTSTFSVRSAVEFQRVFGDLASQIQDACQRRVLSCSSPGLAPGTQPFDYIPKKQIMDLSAKSFKSLLSLTQAENVNRSDTGQDVKQLQIWRAVTGLDYVINRSEIDDWITLSNVVRLLKMLYEVVIPVLFLLFILMFFGFRKLDSFNVWQVSTMISVLLYCSGIAIVEISSGFTIGYSLYTLPCQPILLALLSSSLVMLSKSNRFSQSSLT